MEVLTFLGETQFTHMRHNTSRSFNSQDMNAISGFDGEWVLGLACGNSPHGLYTQKLSRLLVTKACQHKTTSSTKSTTIWLFVSKWSRPLEAAKKLCKFTQHTTTLGPPSNISELIPITSPPMPGTNQIRNMCHEALETLTCWPQNTCTTPGVRLTENSRSESSQNKRLGQGWSLRFCTKTRHTTDNTHDIHDTTHTTHPPTHPPTFTHTPTHTHQHTPTHTPTNTHTHQHSHQHTHPHTHQHTHQHHAPHTTHHTQHTKRFCHT